MQRELEKITKRLAWMKDHKIWPNGLRYLWTDAHGLCLYLSLYKETRDEKYLQDAEELVQDVYRVLRRKKGLRIGEEPDRDGQYFHYLTKWMFALNEFGKIKPEYHEKAVQLAKDVHPHFFIPKRGVIWKMKEDLSRPYPGYGLGGLDHYDGYVVYRLIDESRLSSEISDMYSIIQRDFESFDCDQDLGLGESLWMSHWFPDEAWAKKMRQVAEKKLNEMWDNRGFFWRTYGYKGGMKFAFTNYGISLGLQSVNLWPDRVVKLNDYFENYKSHDEYDENSITHVMACNSWFPGVILNGYQGSVPTSK